MQEAGNEECVAESGHDHAIRIEFGKLFHDRYGRGETMDGQEGHQSTPSCWCHPHRFVVHLCPYFTWLRTASDFEKTFIQCIVFNYETLRELGDEPAVKAAGKVMTKGKDYVVEDGDIILIKAGAAKA